MWNTRVFYLFLFVWRKSCSFESKSINSDYATDNIVKKLGEIMEQFKTLETRNGVLEGENKILNEKLKGCLESSEIHKNLSVGEISNQENENAKVKVNVNTFLSEMNPDDFNSRLREVENKINSVAITVDKIREDQLTTAKQLLKITCDIFTATLNPFDCLELYNKGCVTGVYSIYPWSVSDRSLRVLCDMDTAGGGWTVIQKRNDGSVSFARNWTEYQKGFGHAETEYWLGNEAIHALTLNTSSLYVKLQKKNGEEFYQSYPDFSISDARDDYQLRIGPHSKMSAVSDVTECNGLTSFLCKNDRCISDQKECNGVDDCGDGSDEEECDEEELLVFAYRTSLNVMSLSNLTSHVVPLQGVKNAIAVDFDPVEKQIYWSDVTLNTINKAFLDGSGQQIVINGVPQASGIALDTVNRRLYWTDADKGTVEMSDLDGGQRTTIVTDGLTMPRDIAVDSKNKKLYWSDVGGDTKIEKSNLDGTDRVVIVNTSNGWPNGIALDTDNGIIYWGDARFHRIEMANLDGSNRSILLSSEVKHLFGLSQLGDYLYWSDWRDSSIGRINKNLKDNAELLHTTEFTLTPMDLKAFVIRDQKRNRLIFKTPDHNVEESESFFHDFTEGGWWVGDRTTSYLNGVYGSPRWRNIWLPHITSGEDFLSSQMMVRRNIRQ